MNTAIILAGGTGSRFDHKALKQFIKINNKPILFHTLDVFESCNQIDKILVVINRRFKDKITSLFKKFDFKKIIGFIEGGKTRQESSYNALKYLIRENPDIVVIHDAVRPFVSKEIINDSVTAAKKYGAADVAVKAIDTIIHVKNGFISDIPNRNHLYYGQTPQSFKYALIWEAHKKAKKRGYTNVSDDAQLVLRLGHKIKIIQGDYENIKLTNKTDLLFFKALFRKK